MKRLGLRRKHNAWTFHGKIQLADDQVDAVTEPDWQALVSTWRRHRTR
jgi:hypothetical protein